MTIELVLGQDKLLAQLLLANLHDAYVVSKCICKYISKAESKSSGLEDFLKNALEPNQSSTVKKIIQKVLMKMPAERDYSSQEIFYVLMGWSLNHSSRAFSTINLIDQMWGRRPRNLPFDRVHENAQRICRTDAKGRYVFAKTPNANPFFTNIDRKKISLSHFFH